MVNEEDIHVKEEGEEYDDEVDWMEHISRQSLWW
jgi:hypothetical protein